MWRGGGGAAGRRAACLWFLGNAVEICSIFKILVFPPATHPPSPHSSPTPSLGVCISGISQNHFNVNKRLEGSCGQGGQGYQGGPQGPEEASADHVKSRPCPPAPATPQGSKPCLRKQQMTMTCTHTQFNVAWALCPPPTGWVARALWGCSSSSSSWGRRQNVPLRTERGDLAEQK